MQHERQSNSIKIIVIDDNLSIHNDFIKILTPVRKDLEQSANLSELEKKLFNETKNNEPSLPEFEIDTASQGKEGVEKIAAAIKMGKPYTLAFVDIRMPPGWDGIETIKHIFKLDQTIQVVICTAYSDYTWEETVSQLGQRDNLLILKKPFDNTSVRQLATALSKKWQLAQITKDYTLSLEGKIKERTKSLEDTLSLMQETEEKLQYQATHDQLTDLPNRILLVDRIRQATHKANREKKQFAVLFLDLDRFKLVNDSLSHEAGDKILCSVAQRLKTVIRKEDTIARLGGDEFVVIVNDVKNNTAVTNVCEKILGIFNEPFRLNKHEFTLSTSIGISLYQPNTNQNIDELLRDADMAMYKAKEMGKNQYQFFTEEMNKKNMEHIEKETELRQAIAKNQFILFFQPQFELETNKMVSVEALLRWQHPTKGIILPIDFVPLAEESGLIVPIGEWTIRAACRQVKTWQDKGLPPVRVAVNITTKQLRFYNIAQIIKNILDEEKLNPDYLELELTENMIINNTDIIDTIRDLKNIGIHIALDDFGTGYSCLNYLREIPVDRLKIDQSYVQNIDSDRGDNILIKAIITMANSLKLDVLAEGVETQRQLEFLKAQKCNEAQGYYFSQPISASDCEQFLKKMDKINS